MGQGARLFDRVAIAYGERRPLSVRSTPLTSHLPKQERGTSDLRTVHCPLTPICANRRAGGAQLLPQFLDAVTVVPVGWV